MKKVLVLLAVLIAVFLLILASCTGNKNSTEACLYETSANLDKGNYDAVLASSCANAMQVGAAWFGKAGYDIKDVLKGFIDANDANQKNSDLNVYMASLTGNVTAATLSDLDNAHDAYVTVPDNQDAQFYVGLVDAVKSLAIIKIAIPDAVNSDGTLNTTCDVNGNGVPDQADATACGLMAADNISTGMTFTCDRAIYTRSTPTDITIKDSLETSVSGTYSGLTITITDNGGPSCGTNTYNRLLYQDPADNTKYWVATTTSDFCTGSDLKTYYCPIPGANIDFVSTINTSLDNSVSSITTALTGTVSDVQQSVLDLKALACCGCPQTPCAPCETGSMCSSADIANYLQTYLK